MSTENYLIELPIYPEHTHFTVEASLGSTHFACDLSQCKGACCTMPGGRGAPILRSEIAELGRVLPIVTKYLPQAGLDAISKVGLWQSEADGTFTISTVDGKECIFVHWEGDVAVCAIQTAFKNGEVMGFEKPISCHLFPIRIYPEQSEGEYYICYEEIDECQPGRQRGVAERIPLLNFLEHPISRALGKKRTEFLLSSLNDSLSN